MWVCLAAAALAGAQEPASVFQNVCGKCHPPEAVVTARDRTQWQETINKMIDMGAKVSPEERTILLDYLIAQGMLRAGVARPRLRNALCAAGVVANIALLGYFKYRNFFMDTANTLFATHLTAAHLLVPLGLSFLVFQKIAFLADVRSGTVKSVRLQELLLFTLFFPRAIAGPIARFGQYIDASTDILVEDSSQTPLLVEVESTLPNLFRHQHPINSYDLVVVWDLGGMVDGFSRVAPWGNNGAALSVTLTSTSHPKQWHLRWGNHTRRVLVLSEIL